ncbi:MAG: hypothetical protein AAGC72_15055 [Planctomycetota bacterium]
MDEAMRSDAQMVSDQDQYGEAVVFRDASGAEYPRVVIIDRNAPARDPEYPVNTRLFEVQVARDDTGTRGLAAPPAQGWSLKAKEDPTDATLPTTFTKEFIGMVSADSGGWLVQFG